MKFPHLDWSWRAYVFDDVEFEEAAVLAKVAGEVPKLQMHPVDVFVEVVLVGHQQPALGANLLRVAVVRLQVVLQLLRRDANLAAARDGAGDLGRRRGVPHLDVILQSRRSLQRFVAETANVLLDLLVPPLLVPVKLRVSVEALEADGTFEVVRPDLQVLRHFMAAQAVLRHRHVIALIARVVPPCVPIDVALHLEVKIRTESWCVGGWTHMRAHGVLEVGIVVAFITFEVFDFEVNLEDGKDRKRVSTRGQNLTRSMCRFIWDRATMETSQ